MFLLSAKLSSASRKRYRALMRVRELRFSSVKRPQIFSPVSTRTKKRLRPLISSPNMAELITESLPVKRTLTSKN